MEGRRNFTFRTWAGHLRCRPELYFELQSVSDVQQVINRAKQEQKTVKVAGLGRAITDIPFTDGYLLNINKINHVNQIDKEKHTVRVGAGIELISLVKILDDNGLALPVLPILGDVTLAGAISTGTHGSGMQYGCLSSYVLELELVTSDGDVTRLSRDKDGATFSAACLSVGALGVIVTVKIQCEPKYNLTEVSYGVKLNDLLENLSVHLNSSEHFYFTWFPHTDGVIAHHITRSSKPIHVPRPSFWSKLIYNRLFEFVYWISRYWPGIMPYMSRFYYRQQTARREVTDKSYNIFIYKVPLHLACEWAVPRENTALVFHQLDTWVRRQHYPAHFPISARFVKRDDLLLSPSNNMDSCYINICNIMPYGMKCDQEKFFKAFSNIMLEAGGRIHWAKNVNLDHSVVRKMYPGIDQFLKIRQKMDPGGMFVNDYLRRVFAIQ